MTRFNVHNTPELAYCEQLHERFSEFDSIAKGAQAGVFMLSDPGQCTEATPDHEYTIPRVAKIALGQLAIASFVQEKIGLTDPYEIADKVNQLQHDQLSTVAPIAAATSRFPADSLMRWRLGHPEWLSAHMLPEALDVGEYTSEVAYSQDYVQPAAELFAKLDVRNEHHQELAQHIFDQYVDIQRLLISYGMFDTSFKLLDNYGVDEDGNLILLDFGELSLDPEEAKRLIASKDWEDLPNRREQNRMPEFLQTAFNTTLERRLTLDCLAEEKWRSAYRDPARKRSYSMHNRDTSDGAQVLMVRRIEQYRTTNGSPQHLQVHSLQNIYQYRPVPNVLMNGTTLAAAPELAYSSKLPKQFAKIGQGAQFRVHMLTHPNLSRPDTPDWLYVAPRVIKHALTDTEALDHIRDKLGIHDAQAQSRKLAELRSALAQTLTPLLMNASRDDHQGDSKLYDRLGYPKVHTLGTLQSGEVAITGYTQDYVQPIADLLSQPTLDWNNPEHQELGKSIVDQYVDLQLLLLEYGYFDDIFKLANNCGIDDHAKLLLVDPAELATDRAKVAHAIVNKTWENIPGRQEYDDLPKFLQTYLNQQLEQRLTLAVLDEKWEARKRPFSEEERREAIDNLMDEDIRQTWIHHLLTSSTP